MDKVNTIEFSEDPLDDEDNSSLTMEQISQAAVSALEWTTETILSQLTCNWRTVEWM
jgi:hypothetical protein